MCSRRSLVSACLVILLIFTILRAPSWRIYQLTLFAAWQIVNVKCSQSVYFHTLRSALRFMSCRNEYSRVAGMHGMARHKAWQVACTTSGKIHLSFKCVDTRYAGYTRYGIRMANKYLKAKCRRIKCCLVRDGRTSKINLFVCKLIPCTRIPNHFQWTIFRGDLNLQIDFVCRLERANAEQ